MTPRTSGLRWSNSRNTDTACWNLSGVNAPLDSALVSNDSAPPRGPEWYWRCRPWRNSPGTTRRVDGRRSVDGDVARTELALRSGQGQSTRQATRAFFRRHRCAEDRRAPALHVVTIRHHDDEVDDNHEDHEVDDRRDEGTHVDALSVQRPAETLARGAAAGERVDQRRDDVVRKRLDERTEGQRDHEAHGDHNQLTLHQETLETLHRDSFDVFERIRTLLVTILVNDVERVVNAANSPSPHRRRSFVECRHRC